MRLENTNVVNGAVVTLTAAEIATPTTDIIANKFTIYMADVAPFRTYKSNGTTLVENQGTITNDAAKVGSIGEILTTTVAVGSAVAQTTAVTANVMSLSLTAGDWDVSGQVNFNCTGATTSLTTVGISATSATLPTQPGGAGIGTDPLFINPKVLTTFTGVNGERIAVTRVTLAATTTIYLVANIVFSAGTVTSFGTIRARRMR